MQIIHYCALFVIVTTFLTRLITLAKLVDRPLAIAPLAISNKIINATLVIAVMFCKMVLVCKQLPPETFLIVLTIAQPMALFVFNATLDSFITQQIMLAMLVL